MTAPDTNPYASPTSDDARGGGHAEGVHQQGPLTVIPIGSTLPEVCLFTSRRGTGKYEDKKLGWCAPWVLILVLVSPLLLAIVYFFMRKQARLRYFVDDSVRRKRLGLLRWWGGSLVAVAGTITAGVAGGVTWLILVGILIAALWSLAVALMWPRLSIAKIDQRFLYLKGLPGKTVEILCAPRVDAPDSISSAAGS